MLKVFIGYDHRQPISYNVLQHSVFRNSSKPVSITALKIDQLPIGRTGLTPFTFSRFLVPYLCDYKGWALFLDSDILVKGDIAELFNLSDDKYTVMVSKNEKRFEWASVMLFNNEKCKILTPDYIDKASGLHGIEWAKEEEIGDLPREWNHLVGYDKPKDAKLIHFTQGNPCYPETIDSEHSQVWHDEQKLINYSVSWFELMGRSVHAERMLDGRIIPKYRAEREHAQKLGMNVERP
jgi:hypothetical protein